MVLELDPVLGRLGVAGGRPLCAYDVSPDTNKQITTR